MTVDKGKPPIDVAQAIEYQKLNCESKPESEREKCYDAKLKEISKVQEKRAVIKAVRAGGIILAGIGLIILASWFSIRFYKKRKTVSVPEVSPPSPPVTEASS
jgi:hypothetical protein